MLGKSKGGGTVRVSIDGLVSAVDAEGSVTVSGDGREVKLDLRGCEFSRPRQASESDEAFHSLDPDAILQMTFPGGEICLVFPYRRVSQLAGSQPRTASGLEWLKTKYTRPAQSTDSEPVAATPNPPSVPEGPSQRKRNLFVDVRGGEASIVEIIGEDGGNGRVRRLKEQFLSQGKRTEADRLKRKIIHGENGGAYDLNGLYRPQTAGSIRELTDIVQELERNDGPHAWDRRRYPR